MYHSEVESSVNETSVAKCFGVKDQKGRLVGSLVWRNVVTFVSAGKGQGFKNIKPGTYYGWRPSATRNGDSYGAIQYVRYHATEKEREDAIADYFKQAEKRARKNFMKGAS